MNLSARSYLFFAIVCLLGIVGQWVENGQQHYWRIPAAALIIALLIERYVTRKDKITIKRVLPLRAYLGRKFSYQVNFGNPQPRIIKLEGIDGCPESMLGNKNLASRKLAANSNAMQTVSLIPTRLGEFYWKKYYMRVLGLLRLASWNKTIKAENKLKVVPDYLHQSESYAGSKTRSDSNRRRYGSGLELLGLREYRPGDTLRHIDWKATARSGRHTVRMFTEEHKLALTILVDAGRRSALRAGTMTRLNHYLNIAARLAEKSIRDGNQVNLISYADRPLATVYHAKGTKGLSQVRSLLARVESQSIDSNPLAAALEVRQITRQRNLIIILTDLEETSVDDYLVKAISLLTPKHVPLIASIVDEETSLLEKKTAHHWLDPYHTLAAHESLLESRRAALYMQRRGAHVIHTRPALLDKKVLNYYSFLLEHHRI